MNDLQIFQIIGLYFLIVGISFFISKNLLAKLLNSFADSIGLIFLGGMMAFFIGFAIISFHNIWEWKLTIIVTILGWMSLAKGLLLMLLPEWSTKLAKKLLKIKPIIQITPYFITIIGVALVILGFFK